MFYINKNTELTTDLLNKMINRFNLNDRVKRQNYKNYYDGIQKILTKTYTDASKPCNRTVINYCQSIVNSYAGYIASPSYISYSSKQDIDDIMEILRYNDYQAQDASLLHDALVYGVAAELMFNDNTGHTRFRTINPTQCFGIYDDSLTGDLLYFVRIYKANDWDESDTHNVDVYSDFDIKHYKMSGQSGYLTFVSEEPHYFSQCPANLLVLPDEKSIFDCILSLQDAANELLSDEIDDYAAFCDAYLTLIGVDVDNDDVARMKEGRILALPEGAQAAWLTKNANDTQVENILKRIHDSIYRISQCVDFSSENLMSGVSSGIAIRYKMCGQENRAATIEAEMKKALQRRIEIICGIATLKYGEEVFRDVDINFKRNIPEDYSSLISMVSSLHGVVSDATILGLLPFVEDVNAELEALKKQKKENATLYNFGGDTKEDDEE